MDSRAEQAGKLVEVRSQVKDGYEATFAQLENALDQLAEGIGITRAEIAGIGLDVPAPSSNGVIWGRANLGDDWVGTDIRGRLSERLGKPVFMTNDGNAAALGEYAVRQYHNSSLMLIAPGTGLGGGLVLPGDIRRGVRRGIIHHDDFIRLAHDAGGLMDGYQRPPQRRFLIMRGHDK